MTREAILEPGGLFTPRQLEVYIEGWRIGRCGLTSIPDKYPDQTALSKAYLQGFFDAHAGRDCDIHQDRTQAEE